MSIRHPSGVGDWIYASGAGGEVQAGAETLTNRGLTPKSPSSDLGCPCLLLAPQGGAESKAGLALGWCLGTLSQELRSEAMLATVLPWPPKRKTIRSREFYWCLEAREG